MQATVPPALFLILSLAATICGCTYYDGNTGGFRTDESWNVSGPVALSLGEAEDSFVDFSKEYLHRDPTGSIRKIIGFDVDLNGSAMYWIFGTSDNNETNYYEVNSLGVTPMVWEIPLPEEEIDTNAVIDLSDAIKAGDADGERTITISEQKITIATQTEEGIVVSVFDAYSGEVMI